MRFDIQTDLELTVPLATGWPTQWTQRMSLRLMLGVNEIPGGMTDTTVSILRDAPAP